MDDFLPYPEGWKSKQLLAAIGKACQKLAHIVGTGM
jgi:hypothetical protein